jgi:hydrogenase nickel incorporation protein HypA/HybF
MHEYSIVGALMERIEAEAQARRASRVKRVRVRIGDLAGVDRELLATAWTTFTEKSVCDGAPLDIESVLARWECPRCCRAFARGEPLKCEPCAAPARLVAGDEIVLDRIEMEVPHV